MARPKLPRQIETQVLVASRRRCAICAGLRINNGPVKGQIAHLNQNAADNDFDNLVWLCLEHHDEYDSRTSQSKGFTIEEVRSHRDELYHAYRPVLDQLESHRYPVLSEEAAIVARYLNEKSENGFQFDPQAILPVLPTTLNMAPADLELAVDELIDLGLVEKTGSGYTIYATDRLFWDTDVLFAANDPAADALIVAQFMVEQDGDYIDLATIAEGLKWPARRVNPAVTYLIGLGYADRRSALGTAPYALLSVVRTARTRRLVRDLAKQLAQEL